MREREAGAAGVRPAAETCPSPLYRGAGPAHRGVGAATTIAVLLPPLLLRLLPLLLGRQLACLIFLRRRAAAATVRSVVARRGGTKSPPPVDALRGGAPRASRGGIVKHGRAQGRATNSSALGTIVGTDRKPGGGARMRAREYLKAPRLEAGGRAGQLTRSVWRSSAAAAATTRRRRRERARVLRQKLDRDVALVQRAAGSLGGPGARAALSRGGALRAPFGRGALRFGGHTALRFGGHTGASTRSRPTPRSHSTRSWARRAAWACQLKGHHGRP